MCHYFPSGVGLWQKSTTAREILITNPDLAGSGYNLDRRPPISNRCCQPKTVHRAWHLNISEYDIDIRSALQDVDRIVGIASLYNLVTRRSNHVRGVHADQDVVFNDQDDRPFVYPLAQN
jgi:hypothetical protein